jgi:hypothetical protein
MSDFDPKRVDPQRPVMNDAARHTGAGFNWSWIIGGLAAVVVLIVALSFMGGDDRTADTTQPAATTGQGTSTTSPMNRESMTPAPANPTVTPNASPSIETAPADRTAPPRPASPNQ